MLSPSRLSAPVDSRVHITRRAPGGRWQSSHSSWRAVGLQWLMRWWLAAGTLGLAVFLGGCSTTTQSSSSTSTSSSHNRSNATACSYVQSWAKDTPMTFELFSGLAASAGGPPGIPSFTMKAKVSALRSQPTALRRLAMCSTRWCIPASNWVSSKHPRWARRHKWASPSHASS